MVPLVSAYSFSLDLYIPLVPTIQQAFDVTRADMQLTNSLFMLCCGLGQMFFGPISDRYGRRKLLLTSLMMAIIANIICFYTSTFEIFLMGKVLQAIGTCGTYLCCFATIRDIFTQPEKSTEMFSYLNVANSTSAIIAPTIGTILGDFFGWSSIFFALMCFSLYSLATSYCFYRETKRPTKQAKKSNAFRNYKHVFFHINYQVYTLPAALGFSSFFAYYSVSPYLYQQTFGLSNLTYSLLFGSCGVTFFTASYICSQWVKRFGISATLWTGMSIHATGCLILILSFFIPETLRLIVMHLSVISIIFGSALMVSSGIGATMAPFKDIAGSAFALISAYKFSLCYILGEMSMYIYDNTAIPLGIMLVSINVCSSIILYLFKDRVESITNMSKEGEMTSEMSHITDEIL